MRRANAEMIKKEMGTPRVQLVVRQSSRKVYHQPQILETVPIHRAAELATLGDCPLRR